MWLYFAWSKVMNEFLFNDKQNILTFKIVIIATFLQVGKCFLQELSKKIVVDMTNS
jgi:hypothetical protein